MAAAKKRKASKAQLAALAKGRKKAAANRKTTKKTVKKSRARKSTISAELKPLLISEGVKMARKKTAKKTVRKTRKSATRYHGESLAGSTKRKRTRRSYRRYSGIGGGKIDVVKPLINTGIAVAGGVAGSFAANKLPIADAKIKAAIPVALGLALGLTKIGRKNAMVQAAATGMMVAGGLALLRQFAPTLPLLAGENEVDMVTDSQVNALLGSPVDLMGTPYDLMGEEDSEEEDYTTAANL